MLTTAVQCNSAPYRIPELELPGGYRLISLVAVIGWLVVVAPVEAQQAQDGQQLYGQHCASCHGDRGQGAMSGFASPLTGDLSVGELARYISDTMPEEAPDQIVGKQAELVAGYIYDQFYSPDAQIRISQPRIELARLTNRQYQQSIADLIASFSSTTEIPPERGLKARYFASRNQTAERKLAEQIDIAIDFPEVVPHFDPEGKYESLKPPETKEANKMNDGFSAYWQGAILPPVSGHYRFKVKSRNGFKLYLNDPSTPLIDRYVRSDDEVDHVGELMLLTGRAYHFRIDFFSYPDPPPKIQVLWQPPGQPERVIPGSALIPVNAPESLAIATEFPADDASAGYERGSDVSAQWDSATTEAAIEAAIWIAQRIQRFGKFQTGDPDAADKARAFCETVVQRAFSAELSEQDFQTYVGQYFDLPISIEDQVKRSVIMTLKSPRFLYPHVEQRSGNFETASRMALVMWDSLPDLELRTLAIGNQLETSEQIRSQLVRMQEDHRGRGKLTAFFESWMLAHRGEIVKDTELYPGFDSDLVFDLQQSLQLSLNEILSSPEADFRQLFLLDHWYLNRRLADFYGVAIVGDAFSAVSDDQAKRVGILTHPYLMSELAYRRESSPIHRGVFVAKRLLGRQLRQPPSNVKPLTEEAAPEMTTRQRVEHQTGESDCMSCHAVINALGFSFENFDAVGRFRTLEKDKTIDVATVYRTRLGVEIQLDGPRDLAEFLASDVATQKNFIRQLFQYLAKQPVEAFGAGQLDRLHESFVIQNCNIRQLVLEIGLLVAQPAAKIEGKPSD